MMSKGKLEFNLPEERSEFDMARNAGAYYSALWNIMNNVLRNRIKHGDYPLETSTEIEAIYKECCDEIGVSDGV